MESKKGGSFYSFQFASDELKSNKINLKVLSHNGNSLEYVQDALKKDKEIVLEAAKQMDIACDTQMKAFVKIERLCCMPQEMGLQLYR